MWLLLERYKLFFCSQRKLMKIIATHCCNCISGPVVPPLLVTSSWELETTQLLWCLDAKEDVDRNGVLRTGDFMCMYSCSVCWGCSYHCTRGTSFASQSQEFQQKAEHVILWCEIPNKICQHNSSWVMHSMTKGTEIFVVFLLSKFPYKINGV